MNTGQNLYKSFPTVLYTKWFRRIQQRHIGTSTHFGRLEDQGIKTWEKPTDAFNLK